MFSDSVSNILKRERPRILAFGSSNTQRRIPGMHWFDVLELAYNQSYDTPGFFLNAGVGGETTLDLLGRFKEEVLPFNPHLALITIGGNDANPENEFTPLLYREKLLCLIESFLEIDTLPVLQTYYAPDPLQLIPGHAERMADFMAIKRELAQSYSIPLIDQFDRWCRFRDNFSDIYKTLMIDGLHINETGNLIMGLFLAESLGLSPEFGNEDKYTTARRLFESMGDVIPVR